jgi:RNA polymerase sigma-70 factor (ECF subfamily)
VSEIDDSEWRRLMAAAQAGDRDSYGRLLRAVAPLLRRAARRRWPMGHEADIEDAVQETLKSLHQVRHTYDPAQPFVPWVMAILRHRVADEMRRRIRTGRREIGVESLAETFSDVAANDRNVEGVPDGAALRRAIAELPPGQRTALELVKLKEMSLKEASAETGMSVTALKVATHRALKALRAALGGAG